MHVDWSISIGSILQLIGMLLAAGAFYARLSARLAVLEEKVSVLFEWWLEHRVNGRDHPDHPPFFR